MGYKFLYGLAQHFFSLIISILSLFHTKAAKIRIGRRQSLGLLQAFRAKHPDKKIFWFHAASVGEFEQALPVMKLLKESQPEAELVVSFFSPSGLEQKGKHPLASLSFYLPADSAGESDAITEALRPSALILIKYEFWFNLLDSCSKKKIPVLSVSCILREKQWRNPLMRWHLQHCLPLFQQIFAQNEETTGILRNMQLNNFRLSGDTRIDRVLEIREKAEEVLWLKDWKQQDKLLVIGSAWPEDLDFLREFIRNNSGEPEAFWRILIVPHEVDEDSLQKLDYVLGMPAPRLSQIRKEDNNRILVLDATGMLSHCYRHADAAWIGGAFRSGLHNILEAAVFGIPVAFGPEYAKFQEAGDLIAAGVAASFPAAGSVQGYLGRQTSEENKASLRQAAEAYFKKRKGVAAEISGYLTYLTNN